jgi:hypothetical protein
MYNFYEIRNKGTHRIEYMDLFPSDQKPDEAFRANPASKAFAGRLDLYINIDSKSIEEYDKAVAYLHQKRQDYKLLKEANEEARVEDVQEQPKKRSPRKKAE